MRTSPTPVEFAGRPGRSFAALLPDMRGEDVLGRIQRRPEWENLPVYVVSGLDREQMDKPVDSGHFFQKPLNPQVLVNMLNTDVCAV